MLRRYQEVRTNLESANNSLDPTGQHQRYPVDQMTNGVRTDFEAGQNASSPKPKSALQQSTSDAWPNRSTPARS